MIGGSASRKPRRIGGSALVEVVLVGPILVLMLFGIIQYGLIFVTHISLRNASAAGAKTWVLSNGRPEAMRKAVADAIDTVISDSSRVVIEQNERFDLGGGNLAKRVALTYEMPLFMSFVVPGSISGKLTLTASTVMR